MKIVSYLGSVCAEDYVLAVIPLDGLELLHMKFAYEAWYRGLSILERDYADIIDDRTAVLMRIKEMVLGVWNRGLEREIPQLKFHSDLVADLQEKRSALDQGFKI